MKIEIKQIGEFKNVIELNLSGNPIVTLPEWVNNSDDGMSKLESLILHRCHQLDLPALTDRLLKTKQSTITSLDLSCCKLFAKSKAENLIYLVKNAKKLKTLM